MIENLQIEKKSTDSTTTELHVVIPAVELSNRYQEQLYTAATTVKLPGFRPGKIPMAIVKAKFGEALLAEISQELIKEAFPQALTESKIEPVAMSEIEDVVYGEGKDVTFTAKVPVAPEFEAVGFDGIASWIYRPEIAETDIDESLIELRKRFAKYPSADLPASESNFIACEVSRLDEDGYVIRDSSKEIPALAVGNDPLGTGSTQQLLGALPGETRKVTITTKETHEDHEHEHTHSYRVKINNVVNEIIPEVDEEFIKQITRFTSIAELRDAIRKELKMNSDNRAEEALLDHLRQQVLEANDITVPPALVETNFRRIRSEFEQQMQLNDEWAEKLISPLALTSAKWGLIAERITKQLSIEPTEEEMEREIQLYARKNKIPVADLKEQFEDPVRRYSLRTGIAEQKAIKAIREKAQVEEKPIAFAEFGKLKDI